MLAEIEGGWTAQVSDVLNEKEIDIVPACFLLKLVKTAMNHGRIEMAGSAGCQLDGRYAFCADSVGVPFGFDIPLDDTDPDFSLQGLDGMFEEGGLSGAGAADQVEGNSPDFLEVVAIDLRQCIVGGEKTGMDVDRTGAGCGVVVVTVAVTMAVAVMVVAVRGVTR